VVIKDLNDIIKYGGITLTSQNLYTGYLDNNFGCILESKLRYKKIIYCI